MARQSKGTSTSGLVIPAVLFLLAVLGASWAISSPPGSTADEDFHLGSIWCADDEDQTTCTDLGPYPANPATRAVAVKGLDGFIQCYVPDVNASAACQFQAAGSQQVFRVNDGVLYPTGFYAAMNLLVSDNPTVSLWLMRLASFSVCCAILAAALSPLSGPERDRTVLYWLVASVPLALFLFASVNPSGIAVSAEAAVFVATIGVFRGHSNQRTLLSGAVAAIAVILATASRSDGLYFSGFAFVLGVLAGAPLRRRPSQAEVIALVPLAAVILVRYFTQSVGELDVVRGSSGVAWFQNLVRVPGLYANDGTTIGWLEVGMPEIVWVSRTVALGMIIAIGIAAIRTRRAITFAVLLLAMVAVPVLMLAQVNYRYGEWLQPRYVLAFVFILASVMALSFHQDSTVPTMPQAVILAVLSSGAHAVALHVTLRRYVSGLDVGGLNLEVGREWWWPQLPFGPMLVWIAGCLAFIGLSSLFAIRAARPNRSIKAERPSPRRDSPAAF